MENNSAAITVPSNRHYGRNIEPCGGSRLRSAAGRPRNYTLTLAAGTLTVTKATPGGHLVESADITYGVALSGNPAQCNC